jgi:hypothetical protein
MSFLCCPCSKNAAVKRVELVDKVNLQTYKDVNRKILKGLENTLITSSPELEDDKKRIIPKLIDGLKKGQRKVLFSGINDGDRKRKLQKLVNLLIKVGYLDSEASIIDIIVRLAQSFVGSNNESVTVVTPDYRPTGGCDYGHTIFCNCGSIRL